MGLRKQRVSISSALAFFLGNPVLNPATVIFIGFVLGWSFAAIRVAFGILLVLGAAWLAGRLAPNRAVVPQAAHDGAFAPIEQPQRGIGSLLAAWLRALWVEIYTLLPGYALIVLVLGGLRAWLFPADFTIHAAGLGATALLAAIGTAFVIPTAGEVPIVQTLLAHGMGFGPAAALLITLPAISLPSIFIVRNVFPKRVLAFAAAAVFAVGVVAGVSAMVFLHA